MAGSYVTAGSGEHRVLAVHGWFGSARGWGSLPEFLDGSAYTYVDAELTILPDAGHYPMFESPVSLATSIEEFLARP
jgi:hypothetical protein